jgi:hypothetical protein
MKICPSPVFFEPVAILAKICPSFFQKVLNFGYHIFRNWCPYVDTCTFHILDTIFSETGALTSILARFIFWIPWNWCPYVDTYTFHILDTIFSETWFFITFLNGIWITTLRLDVRLKNPEASKLKTVISQSSRRGTLWNSFQHLAQHGWKIIPAFRDEQNHPGGAS